MMQQAATRCPPAGAPHLAAAARPPRAGLGRPFSTQGTAVRPSLLTSWRPARAAGPPPPRSSSAQEQQTDAAASSSSSAALRGLIFGPGPDGAWDDGGLGAPVVRCYVGDNEQRWYLWYSARSAAPDREGGVCPPPAADAVAPGAGAVGLARSADGVTWTRGAGSDVPWSAQQDSASGAASPPPVLAPNPDDWWWHDTAHVSVSDVQILSSGAVSAGAGVYWMFYSGGCWETASPPAGLRLPASLSSSEGGEGGGADAVSPPPLEGLRTRAGLALSQDGVHWARVEGADHHTGALLDAGEEGDAGAWDAAFVGAPQVVAAGPRDLRLYYHSFDSLTQKWTVGLARSADGLKWERWAAAPGARGVFAGGGHPHDAGGAGARHVVRAGPSGGWVMAYEAVSADGATRSIGVATSPDGLTGWTAAPTPLLSPRLDDPAAWDGGSVGGPCLVPMAGGRWRLYYSGRRAGAGDRDLDGRWCGLGLALSVDDGSGLEGAPAFPAAFERREGAVPAGVALAAA